MASVDLSGASLFSYAHYQAAVGTTWQEFELPDGCRHVHVQSTGTTPQELYVSLPGQSKADGGSVSGTAYDRIPAGGSRSYAIRGRGRANSSPSPRKIWVAAVTSSCDVALVLDGVD